MDEPPETQAPLVSLSEEAEFEAIITLVEERIIEKLTHIIERVIAERGG